MITVTSRAVRSYAPCVAGWQQYLKASGKLEVDDVAVPLSQVFADVGFENTLFVAVALPEHNAVWRGFLDWCARQAETAAKGRTGKAVMFAVKAAQCAVQDNIGEAMCLTPGLAAQAVGWAAYADGHDFKAAVAAARDAQIAEFLRIVK